ncbi:hypothetical protein NAP1_07995 [Erythrobacter sp. NAP1]|uniref:hypothetical protein n=1 Tax=Erythrobacter sp. NAP1 TaxID=237727 RepID=UPI0000686BED|nr:hypothetical protein [Erythrobacter sp. NAP1]EAQ30705.1 hypothetical protein NAP1_07995 [Erythrobacter sp. NAP1]
MSDLSLLLQIHIVAAMAAIVLGAIVFSLPKGGAPHRRFASAYVVAMLVTTGVVAFVPATVLEFGNSGWGFFHLFIIVGGVSSAVGAFALWRWRVTGDPEWLRKHQVRFAFSYAGLLMAGLSQMLTNPRFGIVEVMPIATFWMVFALSNFAILAIAMVIVQRYLMKGDPRRRFALKP